jgi:protein SCO1/2/putative membrane protein
VLGVPRPDGTGRVPGQVVDFSLTDQLGRTVTRETLLGRPWVANFIFSTCPTHCPATLREMYDLQLRLKETNVRLVTITVDPATDTVDRLLELSKAFGADPDRWLFLTGGIREIHKLITEGFQQPMIANAMQLAHSLNLMHVDETGRIVGQYKFDYQDPGGPDQLNLLRKVLLGQIETPEENRFIPAALEDAVAAAARGATDEPATTGSAASSPSSGRPPQAVPGWVDRLRSTNAMLNALATALLLGGLAAVRSGNTRLHMRMMLIAFGVSVAFLACYLTYHGALQHFTGQGHKSYSGAESLVGLYRGILITHVILAAAVPVLAAMTIFRALTQQWERHRRIARVTFPIWLYVSVTGVLIYFMNA